MAINFRVRVNKKLGIQKALKKFKSKYSEFGIREELMDRKTFTKPTTKRRKQKMDAIREYKREEQLKKEEDGLR
jgi:ribosomal protein S21